MILASASPRRAEIFKRAGIPFEVVVSPAKEDEITGNTPEEYALNRARAKCAAVSDLLADTNRIIVAADTIVVKDDSILNKPIDEDDALRMLNLLSGATHSVITAVCFTHQGSYHSFTSETLVTFFEISQQELVKYIKSGEPMDKAGAYGIQEMGSRFVNRIEGDYLTVVGFPLAKFIHELKKLNIPTDWGS